MDRANRSTLAEIARLRTGDAFEGAASDALIAHRFGVVVQVRPEGDRFGHRGHLLTLDGAKVGEGGLVGYGLTEAAADKARAVATRRGWRVVD